MKRLSKVFLVFSSILYTVFLFYVYSYFADQNLIYLNIFNDTISFSSNNLFYIGLAIPLVVILVCLVLAYVVNRQVIGPKNYFKNENAKISLNSWANSMGGIFNVFAGAVLSVILFANNEEGLTKNGFLPFVFVGLGLILIWVIWLPIILFKNK